jgi:hypothetical protein
MNRAVVMAFAMDADLLEKSPSVDADTAASLGYSRMGIAAISLAESIRALGYKAVPAMNDTALSIPLAIQAGLGELGRMGLLITPEYGPAIRLAKVLTDMPLETDHPISFGVERFCLDCHLCADHCPSLRTQQPGDQEVDHRSGKMPALLAAERRELWHLHRRLSFHEGIRLRAVSGVQHLQLRRDLQPDRQHGPQAAGGIFEIRVLGQPLGDHLPAEKRPVEPWLEKREKSRGSGWRPVPRDSFILTGRW